MQTVGPPPTCPPSSLPPPLPPPSSPLPPCPPPPPSHVSQLPSPSTELQSSLPSLPWGSFHCAKYKSGKRCDLCDHMMETDCVVSFFYLKRHRIHGHLTHDFSPEGKIRWFIYLIEDVPCHKLIVGSTQNPKQRWSNYKSECNNGYSKSTGLSKHFSKWEGCPNDPGIAKETLRFTLIDYYDTSVEKLRKAKHEKGPKCRCSECGKLKNLEDCWMVNLGTLYGESGLNSRDEIKSKTRCNWNKTGHVQGHLVGIS